MNIPANLHYTEEHEWIRIDGKHATVGITDHAQDALGDIVYVEMPEAGEEFAKGDVFGVVESVKTTSDLYMPMGGTIKEVNEALLDESAILNEDCYEKGWIVKIEITDPTEVGQLMSPEQYGKHLANEE